MSDINQLLIYALAGLIGAVSHYVIKWGHGEIEGSLFAYVFRDHVRESVLAVMAFAGTALTAYLMDQLQGVPVKQLLLIGFGAGYVIDSGLNKGASASQP